MWPEVQISSSTEHIPPGVDPMTKSFLPPLLQGTEPNTAPKHQVWKVPKHDGPSGSSIFRVVQAIGLPKINGQWKTRDISEENIHPDFATASTEEATGACVVPTVNYLYF